MEFKNNSEITALFKRHIGKILEGLDHLPAVLKQGIKSQLWLLHDDVQSKSKELVKYGDDKFNK